MNHLSRPGSASTPRQRPGRGSRGEPRRSSPEPGAGREPPPCGAHTKAVVPQEPPHPHAPPPRRRGEQCPDLLRFPRPETREGPGQRAARQPAARPRRARRRRRAGRPGAHCPRPPPPGPAAAARCPAGPRGSRPAAAAAAPCSSAAARGTKRGLAAGPAPRSGLRRGKSLRPGAYSPGCGAPGARPGWRLEAGGRADAGRSRDPPARSGRARSASLARRRPPARGGRLRPLPCQQGDGGLPGPPPRRCSPRLRGAEPPAPASFFPCLLLSLPPSRCAGPGPAASRRGEAPPRPGGRQCAAAAPLGGAERWPRPFAAG